MPDTGPVPNQLDKVMDGLAGNPALPADLVRRLFARGRGLGAVAKRPDLTHEMMAEILEIDDRWLNHSLALNRASPEDIRLQLAGHRDPLVRKALAVAAEGAPRAVLERLAEDPEPQVRESLAQNDRVPMDLRARLAADPDPKVRAALAQWAPDAPEPVRRALLTDPDDQVRAAACATYYPRLPHPIPPADLLPALLDDPLTRAGAVRHIISLDPDTAQRLAADRDYEVREQLAGHPGLPAQVRDLLAEDPESLVRLCIFARQDISETQREAIYEGIRADATPLTEPWPYADLDDEAMELRIRNDLAPLQLRMLRLAWVTADPLPHVDSPYLCFRASAAVSEALPPQIVARLLEDEESDVRTNMALHARDQVDAATAERIDRGYRSAKKTNWRPADDLPFPPEVLRRLADDPEPRMRALAPRDPDLPIEVANRPAADPEAEVRRAIAGHPSLAVRELVALLADVSESVAQTAAANPNLPREVMQRLVDLAVPAPAT